jgi:hypothetical protein
MTRGAQVCYISSTAVCIASVVRILYSMVEARYKGFLYVCVCFRAKRAAYDVNNHDLHSFKQKHTAVLLALYVIA